VPLEEEMEPDIAEDNDNHDATEVNDDA